MKGYAIILAAGLSSRMGRQKLIMEYRGKPMIVGIIEVLQQLKLAEIIVVTGADKEMVEETLRDLDVTTVFNPRFSNGEMLDSVKTGLKGIQAASGFFLLVLGDQPVIYPKVLAGMVDLFLSERAGIIIPTFEGRRGHPILMDLCFKTGILRIPRGQSLRGFIRDQARSVRLYPVSTPTVLQDIDTAEDWRRWDSS